MRRQQIIAIVVVLLLAGGVAAGYQFYFRPALEKLTADKQYLDQLNTKLNSLKSMFGTGKPEVTVQRVKDKIQPWHDTLEQRARLFTMRDYLLIDPIPKTDVLKAYYAQTASKYYTDLLTELTMKGVYYNPAIDFYFGMPTPDSMTSRSVNGLEVMYWLSTLKFGSSITRMLVDSGILGLDNISLWEPKASADGFTSYTIGVTMWMQMDQFCKFLDKLQSDESMCIAVSGFRITNTALRAYTDPPLRIELVFQIDYYKYEPSEAPAPGAPAATGGARPGGARPGGVDETLQQMQNNRAAGVTPGQTAPPRTR